MGTGTTWNRNREQGGPKGPGAVPTFRLPTPFRGRPDSCAGIRSEHDDEAFLSEMSIMRPDFVDRLSPHGRHRNAIGQSSAEPSLRVVAWLLDRI